MVTLEKTLELSIRMNAKEGELDNIEVDVYEPETGDCKQFQFPYSSDEHPVFNEELGNEIYSWIQLWTDQVDDLIREECEFANQAAGR